MIERDQNGQDDLDLMVINILKKGLTDGQKATLSAILAEKINNKNKENV